MHNFKSPEPTRPTTSNVREMNTQKFLHTDLKTYLEKDEHVTCISCNQCVRMKDKLLHYKYQPGITSSYGATFANTKGHHKQSQWNLDQERRQLKIPYKPPSNFVTTNGAALVDTKGTELIGAMSKDGKGYVRRGAPKGETEDNVPRAFISSSGNQLQYLTYGNLPQANKRPQKQF